LCAYPARNPMRHRSRRNMTGFPCWPQRYPFPYPRLSPSARRTLAILGHGPSIAGSTVFLLSRQPLRTRRTLQPIPRRSLPSFTALSQAAGRSPDHTISSAADRFLSTTLKFAWRLGNSNLKGDALVVLGLWELALRTSWDRPPVWVHGDISVGNLLSHRGRLAGVLDFGSLAIGDPACDLSIAWTVFRGEAQRTFQAKLHFDAATWLRARAWALWKGLIVAAGLSQTNAAEWAEPFCIIDQVLRGEH
jgi:hypothetical protein